ncbi:MAG: tRNA pseudouridine(38-40) synthase TruA [Myxococcales bacterium]|nr:tRNA pseudouridine(38-40) synthase TruA [Myxococcales bacterium]
MPASQDSEATRERAHGVRVVLAYDGTDFCGWQHQEGQRTVQRSLAEAAARVCQHPVEVWGASRTDSGVHAEGQVAAFATSRELTPRRWVTALNRYLPPDVAAREVVPCAPDYQPRFDARDKTYRYLFHLGAVRDVLLRNRAWHLGRHVQRDYPSPDSFQDARAVLDLAAMRRSAARMIGTHDFRAFRAASDTRETTERTMLRVELKERHLGNPNLLALTVQGTAFMKNMVRIMAGTLIEVGRGRLSAEQLEHLLSPEGHRRQAGVTAPPEGLTLLSVTLGRKTSG